MRWGLLDKDGSSHTCVGNILHLPRSIVLSRFIPTRVGNMDAGGETATAGRVRFIPTRVGNIHVDFRKACADSGSSPPCEWGTCHCMLRSQLSVVRFHPHACGEHVVVNGLQMNRVSVHPHSWGNMFSVKNPADLGHRFIPTRVGNMSVRFRCDHPGAGDPHAVGNMDAGGETAMAVYRSSRMCVGT